MISAANIAMQGLIKAGAAGLLPLLFLWSCDFNKEPSRMSGETMGTRWHVSAELPPAQTPEKLTVVIQQALDRVNLSMSTYLPASDLGRFNRAPVMQWVDIGPDTYEVTRVALQVAFETEFAFNPAVAELVDLWGFGPTRAPDKVPTDSQIVAALEHTQLENLEFDQTKPALRKRAALQLDYSAIAKGYAVDLVALRLDQALVRNYMIEVGGEVRTMGRHPNGRPWRIGIEAPQLGQGNPVAAIELTNESVATSGDYRNYREIDGVRYSHTIDPVSGHPVTHHLASVTVVAPTAVVADAYATALSVMGPEKGMAFAEFQALPVYMLVKQGDGFNAVYSTAFEPYRK
jgi:thiamine biosynthesis lipoprotein